MSIKKRILNLNVAERINLEKAVNFSYTKEIFIKIIVVLNILSLLRGVKLASILFIDIPSIPKEWKGNERETVSLKYAAHDILYDKHSLRYPYQRQRKQFTRGFLTMTQYLKEHGHTAKYISYSDPDFDIQLQQ
nr:hypothetical protein [uncultured archaeon]AQS32926.1 hypothetical protein [uncultured archaeon]